MVPQEFAEKYNLTEKAHNGYIFSWVKKGMHGIPQSGRISYDVLVKHLDTYGYHPSSKTTGLRKHNSQPINFTLLVGNFGVTYPGKNNRLHLKEELDEK